MKKQVVFAEIQFKTHILDFVSLLYHFIVDDSFRVFLPFLVYFRLELNYIFAIQNQIEKI